MARWANLKVGNAGVLQLAYLIVAIGSKGTNIALKEVPGINVRLRPAHHIAPIAVRSSNLLYSALRIHLNKRSNIQTDFIGVCSVSKCTHLSLKGGCPRQFQDPTTEISLKLANQNISEESSCSSDDGSDHGNPVLLKQQNATSSCLLADSLKANGPNVFKNDNDNFTAEVDDHKNKATQQPTFECRQSIPKGPHARFRTPAPASKPAGAQRPSRTNNFPSPQHRHTAPPATTPPYEPDLAASAESALLNGDWPNALTRYHCLLRLSPAQPTYWLRAGVALLESGCYRAAARACLIAASLPAATVTQNITSPPSAVADPTAEPAARLCAARALLALGRTAAAAAQLDRVLAPPSTATLGVNDARRRLELTAEAQETLATVRSVQAALREARYLLNLPPTQPTLARGNAPSKTAAGTAAGGGTRGDGQESADAARSAAAAGDPGAAEAGEWAGGEGDEEEAAAAVARLTAVARAERVLDLAGRAGTLAPGAAEPLLLRIEALILAGRTAAAAEACRQSMAPPPPPPAAAASPPPAQPQPAACPPAPAPAAAEVWLLYARALHLQGDADGAARVLTEAERRRLASSESLADAADADPPPAGVGPGPTPAVWSGSSVAALAAAHPAAAVVAAAAAAEIPPRLGAAEAEALRQEVAAELRAVSRWIETRKRGNVLYHAGRYNDAVAVYTEAVRLTPWHDEFAAAILCNRAAAEMAAGRPARAWADCTESLRRRPADNARALLRRARAARALRRYSESAADFEACLRLAALRPDPAPAPPPGAAGFAAGASVPPRPAEDLPPAAQLRQELERVKALAAQAEEAAGRRKFRQEAAERAAGAAGGRGGARRAGGGRSAPWWHAAFGAAAAGWDGFARAGQFDDSDESADGGPRPKQTGFVPPGGGGHGGGRRPPGASSRDSGGFGGCDYGGLGGTGTDHYAALGVAHTADETEIKKAFRRLALLLHPDKAGPDARPAAVAAAEERFKVVNEAYTVLSDPMLRRQYDLTLPM